MAILLMKCFFFRFDVILYQAIGYLKTISTMNGATLFVLFQLSRPSFAALLAYIAYKEKLSFRWPLS